MGIADAKIIRVREGERRESKKYICFMFPVTLLQNERHSVILQMTWTLVIYVVTPFRIVRFITRSCRTINKI